MALTDEDIAAIKDRWAVADQRTDQRVADWGKADVPRLIAEVERMRATLTDKAYRPPGACVDTSALCWTCGSERIDGECVGHPSAWQEVPAQT